MSLPERRALLEAVHAALAPAAAQPIPGQITLEGEEVSLTSPVLTRAIVIAEFADEDSRALVRLALDAGGDELPRWDASALLLDQLVEVSCRART